MPDRYRDTHPWPYLTTSEIIKHSSNVGAVKIGQRLGKEAFYKALLRFGFGAKSKIELPGEQNGWIRNWTRWRDVEYATMTFGYGITVDHNGRIWGGTGVPGKWTVRLKFLEASGTASFRVTKQ